MSTIGHDNRLNVSSGFDRLERQGALDDLHRQPADGQAGLEGLAPSFDESAAAAAGDVGEGVLNAAAWDGVAEGGRMLAGDYGFEAQLAAMDLGEAADHAADAVIDAFL